MFVRTAMRLGFALAEIAEIAEILALRAELLEVKASADRLRDQGDAAGYCRLIEHARAAGVPEPARAGTLD